MKYSKNLQLLIAIVMLFGGSGCFPETSFGQDPDDGVIEVQLGDIIKGKSNGGTSSDPFFEFYPPPAESRDRFRKSKSGLLIEQFDNSKSGTPSWDAGFRTLVLMQGDFKVDLELECAIEEPSSGWGQGIYIAVAFDDLKATEYRLCRYAVPGQGQIAQIEATGPKVEEPRCLIGPTDFRAGKLTIDRVGDSVSFFVDDGNESVKIGELDSPPAANIRYIEVRCTRQNEGNTTARYLLKNLRIETESFVGFEEENGGKFPWLYVSLPLQFMGLLVVGGYAIRKGQS